MPTGTRVFLAIVWIIAILAGLYFLSDVGSISYDSTYEGRTERLFAITKSGWMGLGWAVGAMCIDRLVRAICGK